MTPYAAHNDPYCYADSDVLINIPGLRHQEDLDRYEAMMVADRMAAQCLPSGRLGVAHYRALHRHLFQDVFAWAGRWRVVRISKDNSHFCYPEHIEYEMRRIMQALLSENHLRDLSALRFSERAAYYLSDINAVHPFREGNGRTQQLFVKLLAARAGHPVDFTRLDPSAYLQAMIASFNGDLAALTRCIAALID